MLRGLSPRSVLGGVKRSNRSGPATRRALTAIVVALSVTCGSPPPPDEGHHEFEAGVDRTSREASGISTQVGSDFDLGRLGRLAKRLDDTVLAYEVAVHNPGLVSSLPCYCGCELAGHGSLATCFRSLHGAVCTICQEEAIIANQLLERGDEPVAKIVEYVKERSRYHQLGRDYWEALNTEDGTAYRTVCSECHRAPPVDAYDANEWRELWARMSHNAAGRALDPDLWGLARSYAMRAAAAGVNEEARSREENARAGFRDPQHQVSVTHPAGEYTIDAEWMARVRDIYVAGLHRADELAATRCGCGECEQHGHTSLGECLTSSHAFGCEFAMRHLEEAVGLDPHDVNRDRR